MIVKAADFDWKVHSTVMEDVGREVGLDVLPENIHIMKKVVNS